MEHFKIASKLTEKAETGCRYKTIEQNTGIRYVKSSFPLSAADSGNGPSAFCMHHIHRSRPLPPQNIHPVHVLSASAFLRRDGNRADESAVLDRNCAFSAFFQHSGGVSVPRRVLAPHDAGFHLQAADYLHSGRFLFPADSFSAGEPRTGRDFCALPARYSGSDPRRDDTLAVRQPVP